MIGRVEINVLEYPRGQKCFHPGDESVLDEGFLPKNATFWLHSCWKMTQHDIIIAIELRHFFACLLRLFCSEPI